jgi:hypothetical protein
MYWGRGDRQPGVFPGRSGAWAGEPVHPAVPARRWRGDSARPAAAGTWREGVRTSHARAMPMMVGASAVRRTGCQHPAPGARRPARCGSTRVDGRARARRSAGSRTWCSMRLYPCGDGEGSARADPLSDARPTRQLLPRTACAEPQPMRSDGKPSPMPGWTSARSPSGARAFIHSTRDAGRDGSWGGHAADRRRHTDVRRK